MRGRPIDPGSIAVGREQFGVLVDWLRELWEVAETKRQRAARKPHRERAQFQKRCDELMSEVSTLRGEVRFLLDHVSGLENASGLRLEDDDRRRYEEIAERYWGLIPD